MGKRNMGFECIFETRHGIWKAALCLLMITVTPCQSVANYIEFSGPPPSLEIEAGPEEKITQNQSFQMQSASLKQFYIRKVWPAFPSDLQALLLPYRLKLFLTSYCPSDGLFLDPAVMSELEQSIPNSGRSLWMCMKPDLFWGPDAYTLLAHEVFHAVHFLVHPNEITWVREGLAQWFEYRVTGNFNGSNVKAAFEHPETSLFGAYIPGKTQRKQYGHNLLYMFYLWSHCGGNSLMWEITRAYHEHSDYIHRSDYGFNHIDVILKTRKRRLEIQAEECDDFEKSAVSFEIARIHNRMNYESTSDNPYHLLATALQTVVPRSEIPKDIDGIDLNLIDPYTPVLIAGEASTQSVSTEKFRMIWLEKYFPYSVKTSQPENFTATRWNVLLIKK